MATRAQRLPLNRALAGALLLSIGLGPAFPAAAQEKNQSLKELERSLAEDKARAEKLAAEAEALGAEVEELRARSIAAAKRAQDLEGEMTAAEQTLTALRAEEESKAADLAKRREQLGRTLGALQRLALQPPEAALARSEAPIESARAALLLRVAIPKLEDQATALRAELGDLAVLRARIAIERDDLAAAAASLGTERDRLAALLDRKSELQETAEAERSAAQDRIAKLVKEARDLRELTERLEAEARAAEERRLAAEHRRQEQLRRAVEQEAARRKALEQQQAEAAARAAAEAQKAREAAAAASRQVEQDNPQVARLTRPPSLRPFPDARASLTVPVRGRVVRLYGQESDTPGATDKGISISARPGAQVVAPFDGKIAYAGPFRGYGLILIIDHGGRYHTILAGFDRIDAVVGQWVLAGEPVAQMGDAAGSNPELYLELRRTGQAINPLPWLATNDDKVRG
ncbi:murein hydrolase activator EnvC family protein [Pelagibius marinus]|uniref:murein hydrolase activator EnvC family protein n=1 Tax=Pelagibius marinus TaxID=2762760 RepID=UPI0018724E4E|nr:peptidoglycan DD-metalloendopeptidase family protein [Pelagibius marinus]